MSGCLPTQALAFLAVFVYATQAIAFEWKPGFRPTVNWFLHVFFEVARQSNQVFCSSEMKDLIVQELNHGQAVKACITFITLSYTADIA